MQAEEERYPEPRYPKIRAISRSEVLERISKFVVNTPESELRFKLDWPLAKSSASHFPVYDFESSDRILLVGATENDIDVMQGYAKALREKGASVDLLLLDIGKLGETSEEAAAQEARSLVPGEDNPVYTKFCNTITASMARALVADQKYDVIVSGTAGPPPNVPVKKWRRMQYISSEEIASDQIEFPMEVQLLIDRIVYEQIMNLEKARLTDPEGTDVTWTNYDDGRMMFLGHEFGKPLNINWGGTADCSGVLAGTLNHAGAFPHIKAHLKDDLVYKVEGGGAYGDAWRKKIEELNSIQLPSMEAAFTPKKGEAYTLPGPGFFWFWEMAIGTVPGAFRLRKEAEFRMFANLLHDRMRAGYVHNGIGAPIAPEELFTRANIPWTHVHIHCMFATISGTAKDGSKISIIDKGHLTALDDPRVRLATAKYGNPDTLLKEAWIPAVPGINTEGDYWRDYAAKPEEWIRKESSMLP